MKTLENALKDVEYAFHQLEFAIKLMCFCELGNMDKDKFDTEVSILLENENIGFSTGGFPTQTSIITASQMLVGTSFGVSAIVLDAAYEIGGIKKNIQSREPLDDLRVLVYMIRCAFAHNMANPKWNASGADFSREFSLQLERETKVDLRSLHDSIFEYEHIGGFAQWYKIKNAVVRAINGTV